MKMLGIPISRTSADHGLAAAGSRRARGALAAAVLVVLGQPLHATEDTFRKPFAEWADLPAPQQFTIRFFYEESEAYRIWAGGNEYHNVTVHKDSEEYGIDRTQGIVAMEYGLSTRWAADVNLGYGTVGTRSFNPLGHAKSTTGLLDVTFGVRYQVVREGADNAPWWAPTLTLRAGAVLPGTYEKDFNFAPGDRSAAIEPSVLVRKHFGWPGFGAYADVFYRWMRTSGDDQYMGAVGLFQEIKSWTINAGYRHFQQLSGEDIFYQGVGVPIRYSPQIREISDMLEMGFSYVAPWHHIKLGFYSSKTIDGSNTDSSFWVGGYVEVPFGGK